MLFFSRRQLRFIKRKGAAVKNSRAVECSSRQACGSTSSPGADEAKAPAKGPSVRRNWLGVVLLCAAGAAACSSAPPPDDEILSHVAAIDHCYVPIYFRQLKLELRDAGKAEARGETPGPAPTFDDHDLRLCYLSSVDKQKLDPKVRNKTMILTVGRTCEPRINTASDYAMGEYALCVEEGFGAARKAQLQ